MTVLGKLEFTIIAIFVVVLSISSASAEIISLNDCGETQAYRDGNYLVLENDCIYSRFNKSLDDTESLQLDKLKGQSFKLMLKGFEERRPITGMVQKPFSSLNLEGMVQGNKLVYVSQSDSWIIITYELMDNSLKAGVEISNYPWQFFDSELYLETQILKSDGSVIYSVNPIVDGEILIVEDEQEQRGQNIFLWQKLGRGTTIILDPIFTVDTSPSPGQHFIDGLTLTDPDSSFTSVLDITAGLTDGSDGTTFNVHEKNFTSSDDIFRSFRFEETFGNFSFDDLGGTPINWTGGIPNLTVNGVNAGTGVGFDGTSFGIINEFFNIPSNTDVGFCIAINDTGVGATEFIFDFKGPGIDQGADFTLLGSDILNFFMRRGSSQTSLTTTTALDDGTYHNICGFSLANGTMKIFTDAIEEDTATGITGVINATEFFHVAENDGGSSRFTQVMDEFCTYRGTNLNMANIVSEYQDGFCGTPNGNSIGGTFNQTFNSSFDWFIRLRKTSSQDGNFTVSAYNTSNIVSSQIVVQELAGTGFFNIPVDGLMEYMLVNQSLNFSKFRITADGLTTNNFISELQLRKEINDTTPPTINFCNTNTTFLGCGSHAFLTCNITDNTDVAFVNTTINTIPNPMTKNDTIWFRDLFLGLFGNITLDWTDVRAVDIVGNVANFDPMIQINSSCSAPINNTAPLPFNILSPANNTNTTNTTIIFRWELTTDPDNNSIVYVWQLFNFSNGALINQTIQLINTTTQTLNIGRFKWNVTATDGVNFTPSIQTHNLFVRLPTSIFECSSFNICIDDVRKCRNVIDSVGVRNFTGNFSDFNTSCRGILTSNVSLIILCFAIALILIGYGLFSQANIFGVIGGIIGFICSFSMLFVSFFIGIMLIFFFLAMAFVFIIRSTDR